jgi:eukaryotic-like serine/threonine-protein kinase
MIAERYRSNSRPSKPASLRRTSSGGGDPNLGRVLAGRYEIDRLLSSGGMGRVYVAKQLQLDRWVAVKLLSPRLAEADDDRFTERFCLEAAISAKLSHPNIVTVHDYGEAEDGGDLFMAMELLEGRPLSDVLSKEGALPPERAISIAIQICRGLRAAHAEGVIHRDLKPSNVILLDELDEDQRDMLKVLDFGLVKIFEPEKHEDSGSLDKDLTRTNSLLGSPRYMAPEQIRHEAVDPRTDIYALGVILYQMISGRLAFDGTSMIEIFNQHLSKEPPPIEGCPVEVWTIIEKCMMKEPDERYASMHDVIRDLKAASPITRAEAAFITTTLNESADPATEVARAQKPKASVGVVVLALGMVLAGAIGLRSVVPSKSTPVLETVRLPSLMIQSVPPGATVTEGGTVLGVTPFTMSFDGSAPRELEISSNGYVSQKFKQQPISGDTQIDVALSPVPPPAPPPEVPKEAPKPVRIKRKAKPQAKPVEAPPDIRLQR